MLHFLFSIFSLLSTISEARNPESIAVLGDSISVGAVTAEEFEWDLLSMERGVTSRESVEPQLTLYSKEYKDLIEETGKPSIAPPTRLWESADEYNFKNAFDRLKKQTEIKLKKKYIGGYIDVEEYSWPFLLGKSFGISSKEIILAGEDGNRSFHALAQAKRVLKHTQSVLPDLTILHFTGNDVCAADVDSDPKEIWEPYQKSLEEAVDFLIDKGTSNKKVQIVVLGHLDISRLISDKAILNKIVFAFGKKRTCEEFRNFDPNESEDVVSQMKNEDLKKLLQTFAPGIKNLPPIRSICRSVFKHPSSSKAYEKNAQKVKQLSHFLQKAAIELVAKENKKLKAAKNTQIEVKYIEIDSILNSTQEDIANDCFHLSLKGQEKVASAFRQKWERNN